MKKFIFLRYYIVLTVCLSLSTQLWSQTKKSGSMASTTNRQKSRPGPGVTGPDDFPPLQFAHIPGAPRLSQPKLIRSEHGNRLAGEGMGWASPELFDVDGDGKKDLLIGEFGSGLEHKKSMGNFIRWYKNRGTAESPLFSDDFQYVYGYPDAGYGTPLSIYTWCCMAFTPRIADLNNDGFPDIISGQYYPGYISWFRGSDKGFLPGERLDQSGDAIESNTKRFDYTTEPTDIHGPNYWLYSSVAFGDFTGDGLQDMIVGGKALRISENTGTATAPRFSPRKLLLDLEGKPLKVNNQFTDTLAKLMPLIGGSCTVPYVADWDQDGILDILVGQSHTVRGSVAITFFRGRKTAEGLRFEPGIALFTAPEGNKSFPGAFLNVCVTDWNNDGINDLLIGTSVAEIAGKFDPTITWSWEEETKTGKLSPANYDSAYIKLIQKHLNDTGSRQKKMGLSSAAFRKKGYTPKEDLFAHYYIKKEYMQMAHKGYVYVLLGQPADKNR